MRGLSVCGFGGFSAFANTQHQQVQETYKNASQVSMWWAKNQMKNNANESTLASISTRYFPNALMHQICIT
jgi:hypothetical protein